MAAFTQDVEKINAPSFLGYAKEISQPQGDKGLGIALEGIGKAFQDFVTIRDVQNKRAIDEAVDSGTENLQGQMIATLEDAAGVPEDQRIAKGYTPDPQLLPKKAGEELDVPSDVSSDTESAVGSMGTLASAKVGRPVPLYYDARMDMLRKDLRSRYPGYKDYIDTKMGNTGNKYISDLIRQVAGAQSALANEQNKLYSLVQPELNNKNPDAPRIIEAIRNGTIDRVGVSNWLVNTNKSKWDIEQINNKVALQEGNDKLQKREAQDAIPQIAARVMNEQVVNMFDERFGSLKDINKALEDIATGNRDIDQTQALQLGEALDAYKRKVAVMINDQFNKPLGNTGRSITQIIGKQEDIHKEIDNALKNYGLDDLIKDVKGGNYDLAHRNANRMAAMTDDAVYKLATHIDPDVRNYTLGLSVLQKTAGPNGVLNASIRDLLAKSGSVRKVQEANTQIITAITSGVGSPKSFSEAFDKLNKAGIGKVTENDPAPDATIQDRVIYGNILKTNDLLTKSDVNDVVKTNVANQSYGPENIKFLDQIDKNQRSDVYKNMTSEAKANEMYRLGQSDRNQWENYKAWTEAGFRRLFGENARDLDAIVKQANTDSRIAFRYNTVEHKIELINNRARMKPFARSYDIHDAEMQRLISRVNEGIQSISYVANKISVNPDAYLLRLISSSNVSPDGMGGLMARAIITAGTKPKEEGQSK